ncbi:FLYWCH zinc finger domain-containing protein [Phthorimaea operculella]|nr:FLYWCH zinc finger domain-containing protein [Phthorimaea operculella]
MLLKTAAGNEIGVVAGFSYWRLKETKSFCIWYCSAAGGGCKARVWTEKGTEILHSSEGRHNHDPPRYTIHTLMFVRNASGKPLAVYQDYCFHKNGDGKKNQLWYCNGYASTKCKARFTTTHDGRLLTVISDQHNHAPRKFIIRDGIYLRI